MAKCYNDDDDNGDGETTTMTTTMATVRLATGYDDDGNDASGGATGDGIRRRWQR
jgi:hypothetical protein